MCTPSSVKKSSYEYIHSLFRQNRRRRYDVSPFIYGPYKYVMCLLVTCPISTVNKSKSKFIDIHVTMCTCKTVQVSKFRKRKTETKTM